MPAIDVLLATYNGAKYLPEQLASLEAQTHTEWTLHLRDDGSTDGSLEVVRDWAVRTGRRLVLIEDGETRVGPAESFARLLTQSTAPYFVFCDQDDVWHSDKLAALLDANMQAPDGAVLAHCDLAVVDDELAPLVPSFWRQQQSDENLRRAAPGHRMRLFFQNPVTGCAMLGNAALREKMLPMPEAVSMHDWWAALAAAYLGRIVPVDRPLVKYRQHGKNSVGARERTFGKMLQTLVTEPARGFTRTWKIFDRLQEQALAALGRFGEGMTPQEQAFAQRFSRIRSGLKRKEGYWMLMWALTARRRWPLAAYILSTTFRRSAAQKES